MEAFPESDVTDIEIAPDGRLFIFGASREVLELLAGIGFGQAHRRLGTLQADTTCKEQPTIAVQQE